MLNTPDAGSAVWVAVNGSDIPSGAFVGGHDNGEGLVVGRAHHEGALIPGKDTPTDHIFKVNIHWLCIFRKSCPLSWSLLRCLGWR